MMSLYGCVLFVFVSKNIFVFSHSVFSLWLLYILRLTLIRVQDMQLLDVTNTKKGRKYKMMKILLESCLGQVSLA